MSPELGFALFLALLWGPTAIWLGYRAIRGQRSRLPGSFVVASEAEQGKPPAHDQSEALVAQGFWVCGACRSVNRREARRCYGCKTAIGPTGAPASDEQLTRPMVPVMAEGIARSSGDPAEGDGAGAHGRPRVCRQAGARGCLAPVARPEPVAALASVATPEPAAVLASVAAPEPATSRRSAPPVPAAAVSDPVPATAAAPREAATGDPVCPFLGFKNDPSTRCDFPDPRNLCHASVDQGTASSASHRRFIPGKAGSRRAQEIGASHQQSLCLTTAHAQCARYPGAHGDANGAHHA